MHQRQNRRSVVALARRTFQIEAQALEEVGGKLNSLFVSVVEAILTCRGKVIVLGMGKSGLIGQKIAGSLSSTGIPAFFVHPAEAAHGDLGTMTRRDLILSISYSGETEEVNRLLPVFKKMGIRIVALTGHRDSTLGRAAEWVLDVGVSQEADPLNLIPTSSTTATLAMGDALLVALMKVRGFRKEDFALLHPGGSAGRMLLKVEDLMVRGAQVPKVLPRASFREALIEMTKKKLGAVLVLEKKRALGILTDGDVRRSLQRHARAEDIFSLPVRKVMVENPKCVRRDMRAQEAVELMEKYAITVLPVTGRQGEVVGMIHLHDLVRAGFALGENMELS